MKFWTLGIVFVNGKPIPACVGTLKTDSFIILMDDSLNPIEVHKRNIKTLQYEKLTPFQWPPELIQK